MIRALARRLGRVVWPVAAGLVIAFMVAACAQVASPAPTGHVTGHATAGPVCPVEVYPPESGCLPRPVPGAVLVVTLPTGGEVARATTGADGAFAFDLPSGSYVLVPKAVEGLLSTAPATPFTVAAGSNPVPLDVQYDTGIR